MTQSLAEVTVLLMRWHRGEREALDRLMPMVHGPLRKIAENQLARERIGHTLAPAALVNEAYLQLRERKKIHWKNRSQFFATAARIMRYILVDYAKAKRAGKRGGRMVRVSLGHADRPPNRDPEVLAIHEALSALEKIDKRQARLVELRYFAGLTIEEMGNVYPLAPSTIHQELKGAKAWIFHYLQRRCA